MSASNSTPQTSAPTGMRPEVVIVLPGMILAMLLSMLDNFIVSTSPPRIVGELGGVAHLSWVVTAYVLGTRVSTPDLGSKVGDMFGRKTISPSMGLGSGFRDPQAGPQMNLPSRRRRRCGRPRAPRLSRVPATSVNGNRNLKICHLTAETSPLRS